MMDYSKIDDSVKEDIADRVAFAVLSIEILVHEVPAHTVEGTLKIRQELVQLINDLGGSVVMRGSTIG
jgi:hypothetical protein